ncbi:MAG TPA: CHAT domain-containing protein [candidate division WOR-3 bacterium]|uniref:CHAT domain-containing protein n=1 Tax=candidate division WOR-3 bacterium TaxID=2052148 RepID=A0A9C9EN84_UNCW3|nr:CHAT domain-containing protein [candidate division WOR-3 bacterium]
MLVCIIFLLLQSADLKPVTQVPSQQEIKDDAQLIDSAEIFLKRYQNDYEFRDKFDDLDIIEREELGELFLRLGKEYLLKQNYGSAEEFYNKARILFKMIDSNKEALAEYGLSFFYLPPSYRHLFSGCYKEALTEFEDELCYDSDNLEQIRYYVAACCLAHNLKRAEEFFRKLLCKGSDTAPLHYGRALVYEYQGKTASAIQEYFRAVEFDSLNADIHAGLVLALAHTAGEGYREMIPRLLSRLRTIYPYTPFQLFALYKVTREPKFLTSAFELAPHDPLLNYEVRRFCSAAPDDTDRIKLLTYAIGIVRGYDVLSGESVDVGELLDVERLAIPEAEGLEKSFFIYHDSSLNYVYQDTLELFKTGSSAFTFFNIPDDRISLFIDSLRDEPNSLSKFSNLVFAFLKSACDDSAAYYAGQVDSLYRINREWYKRGLFYLGIYNLKNKPEMLIRAVSSFEKSGFLEEVNWSIKTLINDMPESYSEITDFAEAEKVFGFFCNYYQKRHIELEFEEIKKLVKLFNFTGLNALGKGNIDLAVVSFELYQKFSRRLKADLDITTSYNNLGLACRIQTDFERSIAVLKQGLALAARVAPRDLVIRGFLRGNIAWTYFDMGVLDSSEIYFGMAKASIESLWKNEGRLPLHGDEVLGFGYAGLGIVEMARKRWRSALDNLLECTKYSGSAGNTFNKSAFGMVYELTGEVYLELGILDSAAAFFDRSMEYLGQKKRGLLALKEVNFPAVTMWVMSNRGRIFESQGENDEAQKYYELSLEILERFRSTIKSEENRMYFLEDKMKLYERMIMLLLKQKKYRQAFECVERAKARVLLELLEGKMIELPVPEDRDILFERKKIEDRIKELKKKLQNSNGAGQDESKKWNEELRYALFSYDSLMAEIREGKPELASLVDVRPVCISEVQDGLQSDITMLEYYVTDTSLVCFAVTKNMLAVRNIKIDFNRLSNLVACFRSAITSLDEEIYIEPAKELFNILIKPMAEDLKTNDLIIVPHAILHYLPFSCLIDSVGSFMIERYNITYLPSAGLLKYCLQKKDKPARTIIAFGNPNLNNQSLALPNAEKEVREIVGYYEKPLLFLGKEATEEKCRMFAGDYNIIHFACHGEFNRMDPLSSALLLAKGVDFIDDGRLEAYEIYGLDLKNTRLVVLSACESGLSKFTKGDEIIGLLRGFIYAGTPTIVASLWKVCDESTGRLMASFYKKLKKDVYIGKALADAERELMHSREFSHPFFWAPFGLYGYNR